MPCYDQDDCNQLCEELGTRFYGAMDRAEGFTYTRPMRCSEPHVPSLGQDFKRKSFGFVSVYCHKVLTHYLVQAGLEHQILLL